MCLKKLLKFLKELPTKKMGIDLWHNIMGGFVSGAIIAIALAITDMTPGQSLKHPFTFLETGKFNQGLGIWDISLILLIVLILLVLIRIYRVKD